VKILARCSAQPQRAVVQSYSDFIDRILLREDLLQKLTPTEPLDIERLQKLRSTDDATLSGGRTIGKPKMFPLVRGGLLYALDAIDEAHRIFQDAPGDLGSYWHGMVHRREGDFENARYWFRRAGELAVFAEMHRRASGHSPTMARQSTWDAYLFTGECEQARFGAEGTLPELRALQRAEFEVLFDYTWRLSEVV
jgi:hypothetical protein